MNQAGSIGAIGATLMAGYRLFQGKKSAFYPLIMIIGSLLEKEGFDQKDKRLISSVIYNRLNKKMKLQIDATVIFAITNGKYDLNRKLLRSDLKINHPFNTYIYNGLPPEPISYVGKKTLDILFIFFIAASRDHRLPNS